MKRITRTLLTGLTAVHAALGVFLSASRVIIPTAAPGTESRISELVERHAELDRKIRDMQSGEGGRRKDFLYCLATADALRVAPRAALVGSYTVAGEIREYKVVPLTENLVLALRQTTVGIPESTKTGSLIYRVGKKWMEPIARPENAKLFTQVTDLWCDYYELVERSGQKKPSKKESEALADLECTIKKIGPPPIR